VEKGSLTSPSNLTVQVNQSNFQATVTATNGSAVPDSRLAIVFRQANNPSKDLIVGVIAHSGTSATVKCPNWTNLGAVAFGARVIEKHFTDDNNQIGPDHAFSMNPQTWREMVDRTRELENALGTGVKDVEGNEVETVVLQRRAIRLKRSVEEGTMLTEDLLEVLRPAPLDAVLPYQKNEIIGKYLKHSKEKGDYIKMSDLE
jgi:N-acetylneuraminate synthase